MDDFPDFAGLRERGIRHAQKVSGDLWTDYNIHDPGVTLLEQTCFALTELAYRADFDTRDLLTDRDGRLDLAALGLHQPRDVLPTRPVTLNDLASVLSGGDGREPAELYSEILQVMAFADTGCDGLYDLYVIPRTYEARDKAVEQARLAFHRHRSLCEDIREVRPARAVDCYLTAEVEVRRRDSPEHVAALVYDCCERMMTDRGAAEAMKPVTRREVFDAPETFYHKSGRVVRGADSVDEFFMALSHTKQIRAVKSLRFTEIDGGGDPFARQLERGQYRRLIVPVLQDQVDHELRLVSNGLPVRLEISGMLQELARLRAEHDAQARAGHDPQDWRRLDDGRRRSFRHVRIGNGLPPCYGVGQTLHSTGMSQEEQIAAMQLRGYLAFSDAPVANASSDLADLPSLFAGTVAQRGSYAAAALDFGDVLGVADYTREELADVSAAFDPWHDRKGRQLAYLLGLYGEAFSQNSVKLHDIYRNPSAGSDHVLENRARFLKEVARLDRSRNAGADYVTGESGHEVGVGRKLAILLDYPDRGLTSLTAEIDWAGLTVVEGRGAVAEYAVSYDVLFPPGDAKGEVDPFAVLVPERSGTAVELSSGMVSQVGFVRDSEIGAEVFRRAAELRNYALAETVTGTWALYLDTGLREEPEQGAPLLPCKWFPTRDEAIWFANGICDCFSELNRRAEGLYLVEDILLRGDQVAGTNLSLSVVMPRWTARTASAAFQGLAEETLHLVCPAHIRHRMIWLDSFAETREFEELHLVWRVAYRDHAAGRVDNREALTEASVALREFIDGKAGAR